MGKFFKANKESTLEVLKTKLLDAIQEVNADPSNKENMEDLVEMVGLVMKKTRGITLTPKQINYVTTRLLDAEEQATLGTGEGKSAANIVLFACQALLSRYAPVPIESVSVITRDLKDNVQLFNALNLKASIINSGDSAVLNITELGTQDLTQLTGRQGRSSTPNA